MTLNKTGELNVSTSVTATTFLGDLNGTINTATTGTTQTAGNNSTLIATTAYADAAAGAVPIGNYLPLAGGTMNSDASINMNSGQLTSVDYIDFGIGQLNGVSTSNFILKSLGDITYNVDSNNNGNSSHIFQESGSELMRIRYDGNVGINESSPVVKLHVQGNNIATRTTTTAQSVLRLVRDVTDTAFPSTKDSAVDFMLSRQQSINNNLPYTRLDFRLSGTTDSSTPSLDVMSLLHNGNVGIGTTDPSQKLSLFAGTNESVYDVLGVYNSVTGTTAQNKGAAIRIGKDIDGHYSTKIATIYEGNNPGFLQPALAFYTMHNTYLKDSETEKMRISSNGNVGIGFTSPGSTPLTTMKLSVNGNTYVAGTLGIGATSPVSGLQISTNTTGDANRNTTTAGITLTRYISGTDYRGSSIFHAYQGISGSDKELLAFAVGPGNSNSPFDFTKTKMVITENGSVGIGTTTPNAKLDVQGTQGQLFSVTDDLSGDIFSVADISGVPIMNVNSDGTSYFDGNVGIGTASPDAKLEVAGGSTGIILSNLGDSSAYDAVAMTYNGYNSGTPEFIFQPKTAPGSGIVNSYFRFKTKPNGVAGTGNIANVTIDGNVGIGTTSPWSLGVGYTGLTIDDTITGFLAIRSSGINKVVLSGNGDSYLNGGNVGIGETNPVNKIQANYAPVAIASLTASAGTSSTNWNRNAFLMGTGASVSNALAFGVSGTANDRKSWIQSGHPDSAANSLGTISLNPLGGNVGIGVTTPGQKLDVSGNIQGNNFYANDSAVPSLYMERGDGSLQPIIRLVKSNDNLLIGHTAIDEVIFYDDAGEAMRLDGSGNLGIGVTSPTNQLHVHTDNDDAYAIRIEGSTNNGAGIWTGLGIGGEASNTKSALLFEDIGASYARGKLHLCVNNELNQNSATPADAKLTVSNDGTVGIGTTSPSYLLDVRKGTVSGAIARFSAINPHVIIESQTAGNSVLHFKPNVTSSKSGQFKVTAGNGYNFRWTNDAAGTGETAYMDLDTSTTGGGDLTVKGDVIAYGAPSDRKYKENIKPIKSALDKAMQLQGVTFDWKDSESILDIKEDIGFIAQDVEKVLPELVRDNGKGNLSLRYQGITPVLLEAIKELKAEIDLLKSKPCNCNNCNCNI